MIHNSSVLGFDAAVRSSSKLFKFRDVRTSSEVLEEKNGSSEA